MNPLNKPGKPQSDRIEGDTIILDGTGKFPKRIIVLESTEKKEYRIIRTRNGGYALNR